MSKQLPKKYKTFLQLMVEIAEHGNDYAGSLTHEEIMQIGSLIAGIQNDLGEMEQLLNKLDLKYNA